MHGVVVVDKPKGMTSHDVVRVLRRVFGTRRVGHAGTLDPMATGVLVVGVGEGTKLLHHLTADDKAYTATVKLGAETDTLDAEGQVVAQASVPDGLTLERVRQVAGSFVGEHMQLAPKVSAIKQQGVALHERVRRGEDVQPPERSVVVRELVVLRVDGDELELYVRCGKGFYVRSLARDLAVALGTLGHLTVLRRVSSGAFSLEDAASLPVTGKAPLPVDDVSRLRARLLTPAAALRGVPTVCVDAPGLADVRNGRALPEEKLLGSSMPPEGSAPVAILVADGTLVAIGRCRGGLIEIVRGILS